VEAATESPEVVLFIESTRSRVAGEQQQDSAERGRRGKVADRG
jgi:hypothetical protein